MSRPIVALIAGAPHGGTTIASIVLGQHPSVFAAGELWEFPHGRQLQPTRQCTCGSVSLACPFWSRVREAYAHFDGLPDPERLPHLYEIVARESGSRVVVDVLHKPAHVEALCRVEGLDLRLIHLVRDGRAVLFSRLSWDYRYERLSSFGWDHLRRVVKTARRWRRHLDRVTQLERALGSRAIRVRYEDLCAEPRTTLARLGDLLGLDFTGVTERIEKGEPLAQLAHGLRGNSIVLAQEKLVLRYDDRFRRELSALDGALFRLYAGRPPA